MQLVNISPPSAGLKIANSGDLQTEECYESYRNCIWDQKETHASVWGFAIVVLQFSGQLHFKSETQIEEFLKFCSETWQKGLFQEFALWMQEKRKDFLDHFGPWFQHIFTTLGLTFFNVTMDDWNIHLISKT